MAGRGFAEECFLARDLLRVLFREVRVYLDRLLNQGSVPVLEQFARFTDARQSLLGEDIANASTPNFIQKDLSLEQFQKILRQKVQQVNSAPRAASHSTTSRRTFKTPGTESCFTMATTGRWSSS